MKNEELENFLLNMGKTYFESNNSEIIPLLPEDEKANALVTDLIKFPHAFLLGCLMDARIKSDRAWIIPFKIKEILGSFEIDLLARKTLEEYENIFKENHLHIYNKAKANVFYRAIHKIIDEYDGDASKIWANTPHSAVVVLKFLSFYGCGQKISTMAPNLLARNFHIPFSNYEGIDVSTDVHVVRVMKRLGLVSKENKEECIKKAKEMNPDFPGIIDYPLWRTGKYICHASNPECGNCPFKDYCPDRH